MAMTRQRLWWRKNTYVLAGISLALALVYVSLSAAQPAADSRHVTMSERIGKIVILYRNLDVWIYFYQALLLLIGLGFTAYYLKMFHNKRFIDKLREKVADVTHIVDMQSAIDFEITNLANKFLFLDQMISGAPIAGLLGTVIGLVQVFSVQSVVERVSIQAIASGMYVAMVTTVCGLIVALIGVIARHFLTARLAVVRELLGGAR